MGFTTRHEETARLAALSGLGVYTHLPPMQRHGQRETLTVRYFLPSSV
jgi:hypothetical protein